jgi:Lon protease-like protein
MNDDQEALLQFSGVARLFPLPNLVLFPHVVQPLHVFEPRYRQLMADALGHDRLITLALLRPGWEEDYDGRPELHPVACLGRVVADQKLPDGRYNLLLRGLARVRLVEELDSDRLYRTARVEMLCDSGVPPAAEAVTLRQRLSEVVLPRFAKTAPARDQLRELFSGETPLGALCDILGFALPLPLERKQALLEETAVRGRADLLLECLGPAPAAERRFPPDFSVN